MALPARVREYVGVYLRGFAMGAADSVPGVSGGTIALITGIYDRLVGAITAFDPRALRYLLRPDDADARAEVKTTLVRMDVLFLLALGLGVVSALVTAANVVHVGLTEYPGLTFAFFFGLIAASAAVLRSETALDTPRRKAVGVAGFLVAVLVTGLGEGALPHSPPVLFLSGAIAVSAMVLPGVSGSLFLLVLGQYEYMLGALRSFIDATAGLATGSSETFLNAAVPVAVFCTGAGLGALGVSHLISWALARYRAATLTFLIALMVGALRKPAEEVHAAVEVWTPGVVAAVLGAAAVGAAVVVGFDAVADVDY
jgi:putative membrane protein